MARRLILQIIQQTSGVGLSGHRLNSLQAWSSYNSWVNSCLYNALYRLSNHWCLSVCVC